MDNLKPLPGRFYIRYTKESIQAALNSYCEADKMGYALGHDSLEKALKEANAAGDDHWQILNGKLEVVWASGKQ